MTELQCIRVDHIRGFTVRKAFTLIFLFVCWGRPNCSTSSRGMPPCSLSAPFHFSKKLATPCESAQVVSAEIDASIKFMQLKLRGGNNAKYEEHVPETLATLHPDAAELAIHCQSEDFGGKPNAAVEDDEMHGQDIKVDENPDGEGDMRVDVNQRDQPADIWATIPPQQDAEDVAVPPGMLPQGEEGGERQVLQEVDVGEEVGVDVKLGNTWHGSDIAIEKVPEIAIEGGEEGQTQREEMAANNPTPGGEGRGRGGEARVRQGERCTVIISGLPEDCRPREVYNLVRFFSGFRFLTILAPRKHRSVSSFVTFRTRQDAHAAIQRLHQTAFDPGADGRGSFYLRLEMAVLNLLVLPLVTGTKV